MKELLEKIKDIETECCVTIILNTHRTKPDIQKDAIMLKNLATEAEAKLYALYDKRLAQSMSGRIRQIVGNIDYGNNLDSLILFVSEDIAEFVSLPIEVENRIVVGNKFATRDLIRALHLQEEYYILVLSRDKARLIEALNDKEIREVGDPFPFENINLYPSTDKEQSKPKQVDLLIEEFFNRVDKALWVTINEKPHSVMICTEERNFHHYMKITDHKEKIIGHLNLNLMADKGSKIVLEAWPIILNHLKEENKQRIEELHKAVNSGNFVSDTSEIWRAVNEGRGQTLFIKQNLVQPAKVANNMVEVLEGPSLVQEDATDDIIERLVEVTMRNGGNVVFLSEDELQDFQGLALTTRF